MLLVGIKYSSSFLFSNSSSSELDSKKLYSNRSDARKVDELFVINTLKDPRPELEVYKYAMPGEVNVPQEVLEIFDVESKSRITVDEDKYVDQTISLHLTKDKSEIT